MALQAARSKLLHFVWDEDLCFPAMDVNGGRYLSYGLQPFAHKQTHGPSLFPSDSTTIPLHAPRAPLPRGLSRCRCCSDRVLRVQEMMAFCRFSKRPFWHPGSCEMPSSAMIASRRERILITWKHFRICFVLLTCEAPVTRSDLMK